ncbi:MAG TPA: ribosome recycling factor [Nitrospiria bacterium]|jgi:ribosome recycling factor
MSEPDVSRIKKQTDEKMEAALDHLRKELSTIRTGRASLSILDGIKIDYYGSQMPLNQVATLSIPESRMITIQPWETQMVGEIEKAILASGIGITPSNDGKIIRLNIPPLTEERRKTLVKTAKKTGEEAKVSIRNIRRDANDELKKLQKDASLAEDQLRKNQEEVQKSTDQFIKKVDDILSKKEEEILEV